MSNFGKIYESSWFGVGVCDNTIGWGSSYKSIANCSDASFSYSADSYAQDGSNPTPTITGDAGGTFSATPSGLSINSSTGEITLSTSSVNSYTVKYELSDGTFTEQTIGITAASYSNVNSFTFDGVDEYISADLDGTGTGSSVFGLGADLEFTLSFWFYRKSSSVAIGLFQWANTLSSGGPFLIVQQNLDNLRIFFDGGYRSGTQVTAQDNWYHVAVTRTASDNTLRGYLNGSEWFSYDDSGTPNLQNVATQIYFGNGYNGYFNGLIDEGAIWNSALSSTAITEIYNSGAPNDLNNLSNAGDPLVWYRMGEEATFSNPGGTGNWTLTNQGTSSNNALSYNMEEADKTTTTPS